MQYCGLFIFEGCVFFGGEILSYDFVEVVLLCCVGWQVYLFIDIMGSYEEVLSNIVDYVICDCCWVQGNIQYLGLLNVKGFKMVNCLYFLFGVFVYIFLFILFCMLLLGIVDVLICVMLVLEFFVFEYQFFFSWQVVC